MEQQTNQEAGIEQVIDAYFVLNNRNIITNFFGDRRKTWYKKLSEDGGITFGRVGLEDRDPKLLEKLEGEDDLLPLDHTRIDGLRVKNIIAFFEEFPEAKKDLLEYMSKE